MIVGAYSRTLIALTLFVALIINSVIAVGDLDMQNKFIEKRRFMIRVPFASNPLRAAVDAYLRKNTLNYGPQKRNQWWHTF
uniref:Uncharacterized protein n=1 Tax=Syphacia muris TaxID=451379 RepID=A0A0N5AFZ2_9BILA